MNDAPRHLLNDLKFYLSRPHECSYLPDHQATTLFADPDSSITTEQYDDLIQFGFRRSGSMIYRPRCASCQACVPVRVACSSFQANRTQRRIWKKNDDLTVVLKPGEYNDEHFALYQRYISTRHTGGGMDDPDPGKYIDFLVGKHIDTLFVEFRHGNKLLAVAVTDVLPGALSCVYTFFDPDESSRSPGVYSVLWQIQQAHQRQLEWCYLGYWIENCRKMAYKTQFRPIQGQINAHWRNL
ncbi:MAG: arginyltransferase [Gammaproteobacteria bacterium]|nr:MAG: arginyltransferase [Gammaproteobacteria bacterium]